MKEIVGITYILLEINLSLKTWKTLPIVLADRKKFLGGKGLGLKLYYDRLKDQLNDVDPLGAENLLCFMAGVMTGTGGICSARFAGINSLQTCQFTSFAYILEAVIAKNTPKCTLGLTMQYLPETAAMFFDYSIYSSTYESITGIPMTMKSFRKAGRRTHILKRYMNTQMGITAKDDTLPDRFLNEAETNHPVKKVVDLAPMIKAYYEKKGYDHNGIPTPATLKALDII